MTKEQRWPDGVEVKGTLNMDYEKILSFEALDFIAKLEREFGNWRKDMLAKRQERQKKIDKGKLPSFLEETSHIRQEKWRIAPLPADLRDRRVEITGPAGDRKMVINALNSGAKIFMADFEDANSPTWENTIAGQINLRDAVSKTITLDNNGKKYSLNEKPAVLVVRPRGWHLTEKKVLLNGKQISASLFDFGLYFYHNAARLLRSGSGPYFYLPKLESHLEARLWDDVFVFAQQELAIPQGSIKATVLIETILAAFEMDEILYELKDHSAGLNCGRWDYIFSFIKKFKNYPKFILPDRASVTMTVPFMRAYTLLAIKTCHKRKAPCIGGMAAQIPIKNDLAANRKAIAKVQEDKEREASDGHDGTWVAHPGLVSIAMEIFDRLMPNPNQIYRLRDDVEITSEDLLEVPVGKITEQGVRTNIRIGILYLASWLNGLGAVAIDNLMEDAATAEISRAQLWQWIHHKQGYLDEGKEIDQTLFNELLIGESLKIKEEIGVSVWEKGRYEEAANLFSKLVLGKTFTEFFTLKAYRSLDEPKKVESSGKKPVGKNKESEQVEMRKKPDTRSKAEVASKK